MYLTHRYIWAHRTSLARSLHDMTKQMYDNTQYAPKAWLPLKNWVFADEDDVETRVARLLAFGKRDDELHHLVARCLWRLCNAPNLPWGRGAVQPVFYDALPAHEKVLVIIRCSIVENRVESGLGYFFFRNSQPFTHIWNQLTATHI